MTENLSNPINSAALTYIPLLRKQQISRAIRKMKEGSARCLSYPQHESYSNGRIVNARKIGVSNTENAKIVTPTIGPLPFLFLRQKV